LTNSANNNYDDDGDDHEDDDDNIWTIRTGRERKRGDFLLCRFFVLLEVDGFFSPPLFLF